MKVESTINFSLNKKEVETICEFACLIKDACEQLDDLDCSYCPYNFLCDDKPENVIQIMLNASETKGIVTIEN